MNSPAPRISVNALVQGVLKRDRAALGRAITLVESSKPEHRDLADELLAKLNPATAQIPSYRIGVTGLPGVGKSTFIDQFGSKQDAALINASSGE